MEVKGGEFIIFTGDLKKSLEPPEVKSSLKGVYDHIIAPPLDLSLIMGIKYGSSIQPLTSFFLKEEMFFISLYLHEDNEIQMTNAHNKMWFMSEI